jgi:hypothetical protein
LILLIYRAAWVLNLLQAEPALRLVQDYEDPQAQTNSATPPLEPVEVPDANLIIRSSDFVNFRVHKPVLAMASPFFKDLLSLPQPPDSEVVDGLPVVQLSESSELLNSLISILYPVPTVMPNSYDKVLYFSLRLVRSDTYRHSANKVLYLLAACQKYEMASVQASIRAEVSHGASPAPKGAEAFTAYAIASAKDLIPEMESAARLTLDQPMTFEILGDGLRLFQSWAFRDLVNFRRRCRDNLLTCLGPFIQSSGPSIIWLGCLQVQPNSGPRNPILPRWLSRLLLRIQNELKHQNLTSPLDTHQKIRWEYLKALQTHLDCKFCLGVHASKGSAYCAELENKLAHARDKVAYLGFLSSTTRLTSRRYAVIAALNLVWLTEVLGISMAH